MEKIRIGISACLTGEKVRYDGREKQDFYLTHTMGQYLEWKPVCPEVECGMTVPREPMRLFETDGETCLRTVDTGIDHTARMSEWTGVKLEGLDGWDLSGFVVKSRSPSCGMRGVPVCNLEGAIIRRGPGLFAGRAMDHFPLMPVEDEERLHDPERRENFLTRIFAFRRWQEMGERKSLSALISFHGEHKLLLLSHSPRHYAYLGRLTAEARQFQGDLYGEYIRLFMEALRLMATRRKHSNVLLHMAGYFKKKLGSGEKQELLGLIEQYRNGDLPLAVPLAHLRHYASKYGEEYLKRQVYLNPGPAEVMLKNHA